MTSSAEHIDPPVAPAATFDATETNGEAPPHRDSPAEEWVSGLVHAVAVFLAATGLAALVIATIGNGIDLRFGSLVVFGVCMIAVYGSSAMLHLTPHEGAERILLECDHIAIYLLIGGTYTPLMLIGLGGGWGWLVFAVVWSLSGIGIVMRLIVGDRYELGYVLSYIAAGWAGLIAVNPILAAFSTPALLMLLAGGVFYTGGVGFFLARKLRFNHAIWHTFTLLGTAAHFAAIWYDIVAVP